MRTLAAVAVISFLASCDDADPCHVPNLDDDAVAIPGDALTSLGAPDVFRARDGTVVAYFSAEVSPRRRRIFRAISGDDGISFSTPLAVTGLDGFDEPFVVENDSGFRIYATTPFGPRPAGSSPFATRIATSTSTDGLVWSKPIAALTEAPLPGPLGYTTGELHLAKVVGDTDMVFTLESDITVEGDIGLQASFIGRAASADGGQTFAFTQWIFEASPCPDGDSVETLALESITRPACATCNQAATIVAAGNLCPQRTAQAWVLGQFHFALASDGVAFAPPKLVDVHAKPGTILVGADGATSFFARDGKDIALGPVGFDLANP